MLKIFKNKEFIGIWLMFYINIHCGLMVISYEKQMLKDAFAISVALPAILSIVPSCTAIANAAGRIGYSSLSDKLKQRNTIYKIIFISCTIISSVVILTNANTNASIGIFAVIFILYLLVINAGYGGGFSTLPALLSERFGMKQISQIHGLALSAWAIAGLTGNNTSELLLNISKQTNNGANNYSSIIFTAAILYVISLLICVFIVKNTKTKEA
jgi:OFA family oxalate/formate antiporter-like MFS transporter